MGRRKRRWGFDDAERAVLLEAAAGMPDLHALVTRAEQRAEFGGIWLLEASVAELDEVYSLVEALMDATRSRKRIDLLEGLLATLCTSMDGY